MGNHDPEKFVHDGHFCIWTQLLLMGTSLILAAIGAQADNGGMSNIPFFITGFILAPCHLVNVVCKIITLSKLKTVTKTNILALLRSHIAAKLWPITAQVGLVWCVPGMILTGIGGLNCDIGNKNTTTNPNSCYYDATTNEAQLYKGLAIGLMVCHAVSLVWFLFSSCPILGVQREIKNDPVAPAANKVQPKLEPVAAAPTPANSQSTSSTSALGISTVDYLKADQDKLSMSMKTLELKEQELRLKEKMLALEERERQLRLREQALASGDTLPPPNYYDVTAPSNDQLPPLV